MLAGDLDRATSVIELALRSEPRSAAIWSDFAAVLHARGHRDPALFAEALGAARRALQLQPRLAEASFNEGLILESLGLLTAAAESYERYAQVDGSSAWTAEAVERQRRLQIETHETAWARERKLLEAAARSGDPNVVRRIVELHPQRCRAWAETIYLNDWATAFATSDHERARAAVDLAEAIGASLLATNGDSFVLDAVRVIRGDDWLRLRPLANAYSAYYRARRFYSARESAQALPLFTAAERDFSKAASPMATVARYYVAQALYDAGRTNDAETMIRVLLANAPPSHPAFRAQLLWTLGTILTRRGLLHPALAAQQEAMEIFARLGEESNLCAMSTAVSALLAVMGRRTDAWQLRVANFDRVSRAGDARELQNALDAAARTEMADERWEVALPFAKESVDERLRQNPRVYASSLIWYILAEQRLRIASSPKTIARAARSAAALKDEGHRARALADVSFITGIVERSRDPQAAVRRFGQYIQFCEAIDYLLFLPEARLQRALALRSLGDEGGAETDLRAALAFLDERSGSAVEQRSTYFRTGDIALAELADLLVMRGELKTALAVVDAWRARPFGSPHGDGELPPRTVALEYVVLPERLLIFVKDANGIRVVPVAVTNEQLRAEPDSKSLSRWLIEPVSSTLRQNDAVMIVSDPALPPIAFASLQLPDGRYLVEQAAITFVPAMVSIADPVRAAGHRIVVVGDPALDPSVFSLPRLPGAMREAKALAGEYDDSVVLTGEEATSGNVLAALEDAPVLHLATHAVVVPNQPSQSYLVLARSPADDGTLSINEIQRMTVERTNLVVLTGCRAAASVQRAPVRSLAWAFIAAGIPHVVASISDVPDDARTHELSMRLHRALRAGIPPAAALREAQLAMIHSANPNVRDPYVWAAFQLYAARQTQAKERGKR